MAPQLLHILFLALLSIASAQSICDPSVASPIVSSIRNVTLQWGILRRGIAFSLGTPPQPLAFDLQLYVRFPTPILTLFLHVLTLT